MTNQDKTLSLHQPWASLLVHGIKRIEGRNWSTNFRGNLWIHATARRPEQELIKQYEDLYRSIFDMEGHEVAFPETYPTGVLVGRVKIVDCLSGSDVSSSFTIPDYLKFEVQYRFCFLCEAAMHLENPIPLRGYPGYWKVPNDLARRAENELKPSQCVPSHFSWSFYHIS